MSVKTTIIQDSMISLRIDKDLEREFRKIAREHYGLSRSKMVRYLMEKLVEEHGIILHEDII